MPRTILAKQLNEKKQIHSDGTVERWRDVPGYEGRYRVSDQGRVKSIRRFRKLVLKWRRMGAYLGVGLRGKGFYIHRLVLLAFVGPLPEDKDEANHKNGVKSDNWLENLEYVTRRENSLHAYRTGLISRRGELNGRAKLSNNDVRFIRKLKGKEDHRAIAIRFGVDESTIRYWWNKSE